MSHGSTCASMLSTITSKHKGLQLCSSLDYLSHRLCRAVHHSDIHRGKVSVGTTNFSSSRYTIMTSSRKVSLLVTLLLLLHYPDNSFGFGWWFLWSLTTGVSTASPNITITSSSASPIISQSANGLEISLGNRENTNTVGMDNGTNIANVEVNYARELPFNYLPFFSTLLQQEGPSEFRTIPAEQFSPNVWIESILEAYFRAANDSRRDMLGALNVQLVELETYAEDVAAMLNRIRIAFGIELNQRLLALDVAVLRCAQGQSIDAAAKKALEGDRDCISNRLERVRQAQREAAYNMSRLLVEWDEGYLRDEIAQCWENQIDEILHEVHRKTLLMSHNAQQLTLGANDEFGTSKANMLQCAENLVEEAKKCLEDISIITSECQTHVQQGS
ncbi:uncharacterized protein LOC121589302 isoform X2 [Anopheles merus]|uniref:uncharacterized protein LOC121589302 isoform X2 n=1 Tax=Anopheles merus TaxID=30066 RepID=UPI001BE4A4EC|nr:uncharacterized protein LOC121589302 isoform X2 [Anopheles merus]